MVSDERRAELEHLASLPEEAQDQYIVANVPASERREFISDLQEVAAGEEGLFGRMAERVTTFLTAGGRADRLSQRAIDEASTDETEYVKGTECPSTNYPAISHEQLKQWSETDNEPGTAGDLSAGYESVRAAFEQANEALSSALQKTHSAWEGDAAESATQFVSGLARYSESTTNNARLAAEVTNQQSQSSSTFRNAMPKPIPFSWESEMTRAKTAGSPIEAVTVLMQAQQKQAESQSAHDRAAEVAGAFEQQTFASSAKTPVFAEPPKFSGTGSGDSGGTGSSAGVISGGGGTPRVGGGIGGTAPVGAGSGGSSSGTISGAPSVNAPGGGGSGSDGGSGLPPGAVRLPDGSIRMPDGTVVKPDGTKVLPDGTIVEPDGTRILPDGRVIPPGNTTAAGLNSGRNLDSGAGAGFAPVAGGGHGGAGGGAAGFGPVGSGAGAGAAAGAGGGLGAGKGSGVGGFGPTGSGAGAAAGKGGIGGMGRGGMGGMMGGVGAGAGRDDEKEHKDQYFIKQEMDPGLHVERDELGEKLIDERTGFTVVPPVIGE